jgi:hypothetical protein
MTTLKIGDKVTTVGDFPTVGIIKEFGYIPKDVNLKAFIETDQFKGSLVAIDLTWAKLVKAPAADTSYENAAHAAFYNQLYAE